jgi:hypothetical protein
MKTKFFKAHLVGGPMDGRMEPMDHPTQEVHVRSESGMHVYRHDKLTRAPEFGEVVDYKYVGILPKQE